MTLEAVPLTLPARSAAEPVGAFVGVVGPSGAGKDSIINAARARFAGNPKVVFARREITRAADGNEPHGSLSHEAFQRGIAQDDFALWWRANGLCYALPSELHQDMAAGRIVVANLSRDCVTKAREAFARCVIVHVTARADILADRLSQRAREGATEQAGRIRRSELLDQSVGADLTIENSGAIERAADQFARIIAAILGRAAA